MHQILGLRTYFNEKSGKWEKTDNTFATRGWGFASLQEAFLSLPQVLSLIPDNELWNLFYTVAHCAKGKREFESQDLIIFDIDDTDSARHEEYFKVVCDALTVNQHETGIVASGHGLHFIIQLKTAFTDKDYFNKTRPHYRALCEKIKTALSQHNLPGNPDPAVWDHRRIMRLPGTINKKEGKEDAQCSFLQLRELTAVEFDLVKASGLPIIETTSQVSPKNYPTPDSAAVLEGCNFLKWCKEKPNEVSEAQWYAMLSVVPRLPPNGRDVSHLMSSGHHSYSFNETESKIDQALAASGPRTCKNINDLWGECSHCPYFEKVASPITIKGATYIKTRDSGFHDIIIDAQGNQKTGKPNFEDLIKLFEETQPYNVISNAKLCHIWNGTHWVECSDHKLEQFAQTHFKPAANRNMRMEFTDRVLMKNCIDSHWFSESTNRKVNFRNGVLDLDTMALTPHTPASGFKYVLDYDYDPEARAPQFEKFINEVMQNYEDLKSILLEFAGYAFSNDDCWTQKALILEGEGANGKSTFLSVLRNLAGEKNCSKITLSDIKKDAANRKLLEGMLFNISEETPSNSLGDSSTFKNVITGGDIVVKQLYKQPYTIANRAKLIFACNELPKTFDTSSGFYRRLLIVPFHKKFEGDNRDPFILKKLMEEKAGIFNLIIDAYKRLVARGHFLQSEKMEEAINEYREDSDSVRAWARDCLQFENPKDSKARPTVYALYQSYTIYADNSGEKALTRSSMCKRLRSIIPNYTERWNRDYMKGKRTVILAGVRVNEESTF